MDPDSSSNVMNRISLLSQYMILCCPFMHFLTRIILLFIIHFRLAYQIHLYQDMIYDILHKTSLI
jgi:hypothetical protein